MMLTLELLRKRWPHAVQGLVEGIAATATSVFEKNGISTPLVVAHIMAQFSHECGGGAHMVENLNYTASGLCQTWPSRFNMEKAIGLAHKPQKIADCVYNGRMGNRIGTDDGWNFRGRGLSQCTGRDGYAKLASKTGFDLLNHPELINDPQHALECGVADFVLCGCLPFAEQDDVNKVTLHLNGGYNGLASRKQWLALWKSDLCSTVSQPPTVGDFLSHIFKGG